MFSTLSKSVPSNLPSESKVRPASSRTYGKGAKAVINSNASASRQVAM